MVARTLRRLGALVLAAALAPLAAAGAAPATGTPFTIDVIASATGPSAFFGQQSIVALKMYEAAANAGGGIRGVPVHFEIHDDESVPQITVQLANQILAKHPAIIMGPTVQATCNAISPLVAAAGPVVYCLSPGLIPEPHGYVFAASASLVHIVPALFRYMRTAGKLRAGLLVTTDATGQRSDKMIEYTMHLPENKPFTIVAYEHFADNQISVAAQLARIKAANPDFLYVSAAGTPFQTVLRGIMDAGMGSLPIVTSAANMTNRLLAPWAKTPPDQLVFNGPRFWGATVENDRGVKREIDLYRATYERAGAELTPNDDYGWDPAKIAIEAFRRFGTGATAAQMHDYIESLHGFAGIGGIYDFRSGDQHGLGDDATVILQWDAAKSIFFPVSAPGGAALRKPEVR